MNDSSDLTLNGPEMERNRLLRRADWRFLLPYPDPEDVACFGEGLFCQAASAIARHIILPQSAQTGECSLVAIADPNRDLIQNAYRLLRPGGVLYAEWRSFPAVLKVGGHSGARRLLEVSGFTHLQAYWAWPAPERLNPAFWLPLDAPPAVDFFIRSRPQPVSSKERLGRAVMVSAWQSAFHLRLLAPLSVVAVKPDPSGEGEFLKAGFHLQRMWDRAGLETAPEQISQLLLTGGEHSTNKVISLVFAGQEAEPRLALKYPRLRESIPALIREKEVLQALQSGGIGTGACLPRIIFYDDQWIWPVLGETPVVGQPLYVYLNQSSYRSLALKVTTWLSSLVPNRRLRPRPDWWEGMVAPAIRQFENSFGPILEAGDMPRMMELLKPLDGLPAACEQRDCSPWNLLITPKGELGVLDWESAELNGLPGLDLIYFLTYLAFFQDGAMESGAYLESYRRAKDSYTFTGKVQAECERVYLLSTGLNASALRPLRLLAWLIHSRSDYQKISADSHGRPDRERLRNSLFYRLWRTELAEAV